MFFHKMDKKYWIYGHNGAVCFQYKRSNNKWHFEKMGEIRIFLVDFSVNPW